MTLSVIWYGTPFEVKQSIPNIILGNILLFIVAFNILMVIQGNDTCGLKYIKSHQQNKSVSLAAIIFAWYYEPDTKNVIRYIWESIAFLLMDVMSP